MAVVFFNKGLDELRTFTTDTFKMGLFTVATHDIDADFIDDLSGRAVETGYADQTLSGKSRNVDDTNNWIQYECSSYPDFAGIDPGETYLSVVLFKFVTNDTDSIPVAYEEFVTSIESEDMGEVIITDDVIARVQEA